MKVCYIISDIDKAVYFEQTALELRKSGVDLSFILLACTDKTLHHFLVEHQFQVVALEVGSLLKSRKVILECKRILKEWNITHVHCHLAQANWVGLWASKLAGIKTRIYTRHSGKPLKMHWKEWVIDRIQNKLASHIVSISKNTDNLLASQGVPTKKRKIIYHGFNLKRFEQVDESEVERIQKQYNPHNQAPCIGVIARWLELKGIHYVIDAFEKLLNDFPQARLFLFGASEQAEYANEIKAKLSHLPPNAVYIVEFEPNVYDLYQLFDVYVHVPVNSACEAFGQTYVEALAAGIPSVFTLSGIGSEFIRHEYNALVVPYQNSQAIYASITKLLRNQSLANRLKENGRKDVETLFAFDKSIRELVALYKGF